MVLTTYVNPATGSNLAIDLSLCDPALFTDISGMFTMTYVEVTTTPSLLNTVQTHNNKSYLHFYVETNQLLQYCTLKNVQFQKTVDVDEHEERNQCQDELTAWKFYNNRIFTLILNIVRLRMQRKC